MSLGAALEKQGMLAEALAQYERGMQLAPHEQQNRLIFSGAPRRSSSAPTTALGPPYQSAIAEGAARGRRAQEPLGRCCTRKKGELELAAGRASRRESGSLSGDADLKVRLAELQYRQKKFDVAETNLATALRTPGPHLAHAHYLRAFLAFRKGNSAGAQKELDDALALAPDMAEAYYQKGEMYVAAGTDDLARQNYTKAWSNSRARIPTPSWPSRGSLTRKRILDGPRRKHMLDVINPGQGGRNIHVRHSHGVASSPWPSFCSDAYTLWYAYRLDIDAGSGERVTCVRYVDQGQFGQAAQL